MKRLRQPRVPHCRWVDVVGRNRAQLDRVRERLGLPAGLVPLSLVEHLQPTVIRVRPAWFLLTYFTAPSRSGVFARQPLCVWLADWAIVTISPWARRRSVLGATETLGETRDDFLCRVMEEAVRSHAEVGGQLGQTFMPNERDEESPHAWHRKELRLARFGQLLEHQLEFLRAVGVERARMQRAYQQLAGLVQVARYADRKVRDTGYCALCRHGEAIARRRGR